MKVSVIVPTFRSGAGLQRVIDSLDAQTMPADEFEVIFVDDGSADTKPNDDTLARLYAIAATRPNVRIIESENSGWGSRPRNLGVAAATGEYVTFMDHDDSLFPDALRSAYDAGAAASADFVNPKEVSTRGWTWGWDVWAEDRTISRDEMRPVDVTPLIPHKLYRREFLLEHGIRFPEGPRVFWEDFYVNTAVYVHAQSIAVVASVPFYKWHRDTGSNSSDKVFENVEEFWRKLGEVSRFMSEATDVEADRRWMLINIYKRWVLDLFGARMLKRERDFIEQSMPFVAKYIADWIPDDAERDLERAQQTISYLLRHGDLAALTELAHWTQGVRATGRDTEIAWRGGVLELEYSATWTHRDGKPLLFRRVGDRYLRVLSGSLDAAIPENLRDVTEALEEATGAISVRSRDDRLGWRMPSSSVVRLDEEGDDLISLRVTVTSSIDPTRGVFGGELGEGVWDVGARFEFMGLLVHNVLRFDAKPVGALIPGRTALAYSTGHGALAIDLGNSLKSFIAPPRLNWPEASAQRVSGLFGRELSIPLRRVEAAVDTVVNVEVEYDGTKRVAGRIVSRNGVARLHAPVAVSAGTHTWRVISNGVRSAHLRQFTVDRLGRVRFADES